MPRRLFVDAPTTNRHVSAGHYPICPEYSLTSYAQRAPTVVLGLLITPKFFAQRELR
jgi:hypothetical protein